jgi:two-component system cell cycle sensor histidine kinase/response regulator CckA
VPDGKNQDAPPARGHYPLKAKPRDNQESLNPPTARLRGPYLAAVITLVVLTGFIAFLVGNNYLAQIKLHKFVVNNFHQTLERRALALSHFFSERTNDLKHLPAKREISIFFENQALGMSMEYGLRASLIAIQRRFESFREDRKLGNLPVYTRLGFIDKFGKCLVDNPGGPAEKNWGRFLTPTSSDPVILVEKLNGVAQVMVSCPFFFKDSYVGQILAWISPATINSYLSGAMVETSKEIIQVYSRQGDFYLYPPKNVAYLPDVASLKEGKFHRFTAVDHRRNRVEMIATQVPIPGTPFSLIGVMPASELFGHLSPWHLLVVLASLSALFLLGTGIIWRVNNRNLALHIRLDEASIREREIEEKNRQLQEEISERQRVDKALLQSETKYRLLVNQIPALVYRGYGDWSIDFFDNKIELLTGYSQEAFNARKILWSDVILPEDLPGAKRACLKASKTNKSCIREYRIKNKDGEVLWIQERGQIFCNPAGEIDYISGVFFNISDLKKFEEERLMFSKLESLGLLAGGIAHDFNNILTAILGNISLAKLDRASPGHGLERLTEAERACFQAQALARQLLTFAKGGSPVKTSISVAELITESAHFAARGSQVRCEFVFPDDLWAVEADPGQTSQVFQNLIINAIQAMPSGGTIKIQGANLVLGPQSNLPLNPGKYVKISIQDQGLGIPANHLAKIFDPYFTTKQKGSGLGLATAFSIIKKHSAHITVESQLGQGTTFHIYFPAFDQKLIPPTPEEADLLAGSGNILVMDDEEMVLQVLDNMLKTPGYEVTMARDGGQALEMFTQAHTSGQSFAAVILDLTVPGGMGGQETLEKLRLIDPQVKAIVSSGYSDDPVIADFAKFGFSGVIVKPYSILELSHLLHKVILPGN